MSQGAADRRYHNASKLTSDRTPVDQTEVAAWRLSQPDLIDCPLCSQPITLRSCTDRLKNERHYWKKVDCKGDATDPLEVAEGYWKCRDSGCSYYELPDKGKRAHCYRGSGRNTRSTVQERLTADA